jgi:hypothetical protein
VRISFASREFDHSSYRRTVCEQSGPKDVKKTTPQLLLAGQAKYFRAINDHGISHSRAIGPDRLHEISSPLVAWLSGQLKVLKPIPKSKKRQVLWKVLAVF